MANVLGFEIQKANGKTNWQDIRRFFYVTLLVWIVGVRLIGLNPFDDFGRTGGAGLDTLIDALCLYGVWLICWHTIWDSRPRI